MEDIKIRSVTPEDYEEIYTLSAELGYSYPVEKIRDRIRQITENTKDMILVAEPAERRSAISMPAPMKRCIMIRS